MSRRIYVAGPMSGRPLYNWPAFEEAANLLRRGRCKVVSPVEIDEQHDMVEVERSSDGSVLSVRESATFDYDKILELDLAEIENCDAIYLLEGWQESTGALTELIHARSLDLEELWQVTPEAVPPYQYTTEDLVEMRAARRAWTDQVRAAKVSEQRAEDHKVLQTVTGNRANAALAAPVPRPDRTNPKDLAGQSKPQMHLVPPAAVVRMAKVMELGAEKYGPANWRENDIRLTVYISAAQRHMAALLDGEATDPESGQPHAAHVACCMAIVLDAEANGNLIDDRPTPGPAAALLAELTEATS